MGDCLLFDLFEEKHVIQERLLLTSVLQCSCSDTFKGFLTKKTSPKHVLRIHPRSFGYENYFNLLETIVYIEPSWQALTSGRTLAVFQLLLGYRSSPSEVPLQRRGDRALPIFCNYLLFAITLKNYKLCYLKSNWSLIMHF